MRVYPRVLGAAGASTRSNWRILTKKLVRLADAADDEIEAESDGQGDAQGGDRKSTATLLLEIAGDVELWHTPDGEPFGTIFNEDHFEHWRINVRPFRRWLSQQFFEQTGKTANSQALQDAIGVLEGKAVFHGDQHYTFVRVAGHEGRVYLDLANDQWEVVEIDRSGWRVVSDPPVKFRRAKAMLPLPHPETGGELSALRRFVNVTDDGWTLLVSVAWSVRCVPRDRFPSWPLFAEQGSGKSTVFACHAGS